ncbi:MAG: hypothetical protein GVY13_10910 [Alphaproteobacteria bacterium]|nr:hypothetical protein [Alphaproteobacteria bacterium]
MGELTLHDQETCALAERLAARLEVSTEEAVRVALRAYQSTGTGAQPSDTEADHARRMADLEALIDRIAASARPGSHQSDDAMLYDDHGLPK